MRESKMRGAGCSLVAGQQRCAGRCGLVSGTSDFHTEVSPRAPYHIRTYQESDRTQVLALFSRGMEEHIPTTFYYILKLPRTLLLLLGIPVALFLVSGSWLLVPISSLILLVCLWFLAKYTWIKYKVAILHTDLADITKSYLSKPGSCFWVAEYGGQVVGMVGAQLVKDPPHTQKKQVKLQHLSVALEHRRQGIGKALVRTLLQFARDQGYSEVVLATSVLQDAALALYHDMGFQKTGQFFFTTISKLRNSPLILFTYSLTSHKQTCD
ncbi:LOW QUALITY PROTEIN: N-acetyltransferase family 8 member 3-like [Thomomys bottae]